MNGVTLSLALLMGLTGSLHCAGMCGPIIWVMPFSMMQGLRKWAGILLYHFGRISVYALMILILHSFKDLFQPQWQQYTSLMLGALLLAMSVASFVPGTKYSVTLPWTEQVKKHLGKFISNPNLPALFVSGMLNGLLPCGLVYMALSAFVTVPDTAQAVTLMYAFGLGTMPMLVSITILKKRASFLHIQHLKKMVPVIMFLFGSLFVVRGMNLGIPYLSPKVAVVHDHINTNYCHKP